MVELLILATALSLSGCQAPSNATKWWNPTTWFSGRAGSQVESRKQDLDEASEEYLKEREILLKVAQEEVSKADMAIRVAPPSRPAVVAGQASGKAVVALDEALGPIPEARIQQLEALVAALISENAEQMAAVEAEIRDGNQRYERAISDLQEASREKEEAEAALLAAHTNLEAAFARENALADRYRNIKFMFWGVIILGVIIAGVVLYLRIMGMGALTSVVGGIERIKQANPGSPVLDDLLTQLSRSMNDRDKKAIRNIRAKQIKTDDAP